MIKPALVTVLLASSALVAPLAHGQTAATTAAAAAPASDTAIPAPSRTTAEDVVVYAASRKSTGGGLIKVQDAAKSVSTVSSAFIQSQSSIENVYQYVQLTPGALVSTTDPYGLNEQYAINIHGLGQDELGYTLEGMPLNDIGYYSAYPSQFIDSENIDEVSLSQGSADLDSPVISAAGGIMNIFMLDPSVRRGGSIDVSYGTYNTDREFVRFDSGLIGDTGFRAFISYSHTSSDNWHGPGVQKRQHIDYKVVREWGNGNRITLTGTYHDAITPLYVEPTLSNFQTEGAKGVDNNYDKTFTPGDTNFYGLHIGTFRILYMSAPARLHLNENFTLNVTPYWQYGYGNSPYGTNITPDGNYQGTDGPYTLNIPNYAATGGTVMANFQDLQYREGLVSKLTYTTGPNSLMAGFWIDHSDETDTQSVSWISPQGFPVDIWADNEAGTIKLPSGGLFLLGGDRVLTNIVEPFVADTVHLFGDKLTIEAGFKFAWIWRSGFNELPGPQTNVKIDNFEPLPRAAIRYQINDQNQVFVSVSTNFRTPSEQTMFNSYYEGYQYGTVNANLKPEYSTSEDVGYRYTGHLVTASATVFNYYFTNRQVSTYIDSGTINESVNAGSQTTYGLDLEAGTRPWRHISPYASFEYLHSTEDNNLPYNGGYLATAGKTSIRSPKFQGALGLNYDDGTFFANFNAKYVDSQYSTFMDDEKIPSYITANLGVGVRLPAYAGLRAGPELKLNVINLTGHNYLASVANPTPSVSVGSPTYYLAGGQAVMFTAKQAF